MTVAAPVTVAQLVLLKGPVVKSTARECTTHTHTQKERRSGWEKPVKGRSYDRRNLTYFFPSDYRCMHLLSVFLLLLSGRTGGEIRVQEAELRVTDPK